MKDLVRKLILGQWVMIHLLSTATKGPARLSLSLTVSSAFWKKRVSLCGLVNGEKKIKKKLEKCSKTLTQENLLLTVLKYIQGSGFQWTIEVETRFTRQNAWQWLCLQNSM